MKDQPIPAGKTPVILTFWDGAKGQFGLADDGSYLPDTAVGRLQKFYKKHRDFGRAATFFLNPPEKERDDVSYKDLTTWREVMQRMAEDHYEFGNHTVHGYALDTLQSESIMTEIALGQLWIQSIIPKALVNSIALPYGRYPLGNRQPPETLLGYQSSTAWSGVWLKDNSDVTYGHRGVVNTVSEPAQSPFSVHYDGYRLPSIQVVDPSLVPKGSPVFAHYLQFFDEHPSLRYLSDGNPDTVTIPVLPGRLIQRLDIDLSKVEPPELVDGSGLVEQATLKPSAKTGPTWQKQP
jgi:peptidoglycan/xylan/chitin deacetylase (PgdA/CDA1 family)